MEHSQQLLKYIARIANPWNAAAGLSRPELNISHRAPKGLQYFSPTARRATHSFRPARAGGTAARGSTEISNGLLDACGCLVFRSCLGSGPEPDCCGVVTFAYARLCATTPCGTRTRNLWNRSPTPCPLGQGGRCNRHRAATSAKVPANSLNFRLAICT